MSIESVLADYMKKLSGPACIDQLFPAEFIESHTHCASAKEFFRGAGVENQATYDAWSSDDPDNYVKDHSEFASWDEMFEAAAKLLAQTRQNLLRSGDSFLCAPINDDPFSNIKIEINFVAN